MNDNPFIDYFSKRKLGIGITLIGGIMLLFYDNLTIITTQLMGTFLTPAKIIGLALLWICYELYNKK